MRGYQLARQWPVGRAIEASPNGLTVAELAKQEETGLGTIYQDLEDLQADSFSLYIERVNRSNRWAFRDIFKFKIPPPFLPSLDRDESTVKSLAGNNVNEDGNCVVPLGKPSRAKVGAWED